MGKNDIDMTEAEAKSRIAEHEAKHGKQMKTPPGKGRHDAPTEAQYRDAEPPDWFREERETPHGWRKADDTFVRVDEHGNDLPDE